jgi:hypothetical protein
MYEPSPTRMWMVYDQRFVGAFTTPLNLASFPVSIYHPRAFALC